MHLEVPQGFYEEWLRAVRAGGGDTGLMAAPLGMPGVVDHGVHYLGRRLSQYIDGRHYTEYVPDIEKLKRERRYADAEPLLLRICKVIEAEPDFIPPAYYEHLAIIYSKQKRWREAIAICDRYEQMNAGRGGRGESALAVRARTLRAKHGL